ncbi:hypothetical protein [Caulobacter sp. LjRoot300]|uniref:hypothetical protein n=1 Tax=Caulobacter sp. LjRoot300 TaxID=3342321 RepID=UPI003ECEF8F9
MFADPPEIQEARFVHAHPAEMWTEEYQADMVDWPARLCLPVYFSRALKEPRVESA